MSNLGIIVIGRNEGERLHRCLRSVVGQGHTVVYVDSGSTDESVAFSRSLGVELVELDVTSLFTAARARNAGFEKLIRISPTLEFVQFVDGDCEVVEGWLETAVDALRQRKDVAVVCGRLRERNREVSIYNRLCDMEWDVPAGEVLWCGGIAMLRVEAFLQVRGFRTDMIAGEEPELCVRLRGAGWRVWRLKKEMAVHDAAMMHFARWWKRSSRAGYAFAEGAWLHGRSQSPYNQRLVASIVVWAAVVPAMTALFIWPSSGWSLCLLALYPIQWMRIMCQQRRQGRSPSDGRIHAIFTILGKFAQLIGAGRWLLERLRAMIVQGSQRERVR